MFAGAAILVLFGFVDELRSHVATTDFAGFWAGPRALLDGADPYDPATWQATIARLGTQQTSELVYGYPPWVLLALLPLGALPLGLATLVWTLGGLSLAVIGIWSLLRVIAPDCRLLSLLAGLCLLGSAPAIISFYSGQWSFLLVGATGLGYTFLLRGHERRAAFIGLVAIAKPHLFVLTSVGLVRAGGARRWRVFLRTAALGGAVVLAGVFALRPAWVVTWLTLIPLTRAGTTGIVTLPNALGDLIGPTGQWLGIAALLVGLVLALRFEPRGDASLASWTALSASAVVYGWSYDHTLLVVPLTLAGGIAHRYSRVRGHVIVAAGASLILIGEIVLYQVAVTRSNQSFSAFVPAAFAGLVIAGLWPLRHAIGGPAGRANGSNAQP